MKRDLVKEFIKKFKKIGERDSLLCRNIFNKHSGDMSRTF